MNWNEKCTSEDVLRDIRKAQEAIMENPPLYTVCTVRYCPKCELQTIHLNDKCQHLCLVREK